MAIKKRPDYKHIGQVGHLKIAQKYTKKGTVITGHEIVLLKGSKKEVANGFATFHEAHAKATELMAQHSKLVKK